MWPKRSSSACELWYFWMQVFSYLTLPIMPHGSLGIPMLYSTAFYLWAVLLLLGVASCLSGLVRPIACTSTTVQSYPVGHLASLCTIKEYYWTYINIYLWHCQVGSHQCQVASFFSPVDLAYLEDAELLIQKRNEILEALTYTSTERLKKTQTQLSQIMLLLPHIRQCGVNATAHMFELQHEDTVPISGVISDLLAGQQPYTHKT